ncbi:MAG: VWA domain-containing protein [Actinobacteria bacterium]|nr:VWA domain-containing protein [Actinomycetota bacterium]
MSSTLLFVDALQKVGIATRDAVYWAGRATLVRRPEDIPLYDRVFDALWMRRRYESRDEGDVEHLTIATDDDNDDEPDAPEGDDQGDDVITVRFSTTEVLAHKDFAEYTAAELAEARQLMSRMHLVGSPRRSRRRVRSKRTRGRPDLRRTVRAAIRSGGEPIHRSFTEPGQRPRRLVLLLDVSGSMEAYSRALVRFVHAAVVGRTKVEAFALGTRLTRITRELSTRDPDAAIHRAADRVVDWSGGTRLGDGLRQFNDEWGQRGMARGAIVVILSDGWDRGEPAVMAEQMARLSRVAHKVVWVNPLKASPGYAPLAQGMAAALPYIHSFIEGHSLDSLEQLAEVIAT